jgi:mRNA interferase MazF
VGRALRVSPPKFIRRKMEVYRGDIFLVELSGKGNEQSGTRPVVIIQNNTGNKYSPCIIAACITSQTKKNIPTHVDIDLIKPSTVLCEQIYTLSKDRLIKKIGRLTENTMKLIDKRLLISLGIEGGF